MDQVETFNVIALGFDTPEHVAVEGLQRLFGIGPDDALRLVRSTPRAIKHDASRELALRYGKALSSIGGRFELQRSSDALIETSAGEHNSPVVRRSVMPAALGGDAVDESSTPPRRPAPLVPLHSGLELDVDRANRTVRQGHNDDRGDPDKVQQIARADGVTYLAAGASWRPAPSQSLPPPRMTSSAPPPSTASVHASRPPSTATAPAASRASTILMIVGGTLIVAGMIVVRGGLPQLSALAPVLLPVGALLAARGFWQRITR